MDDVAMSEVWVWGSIAAAIGVTLVLLAIGATWIAERAGFWDRDRDWSFGRVTVSNHRPSDD